MIAKRRSFALMSATASALLLALGGLVATACDSGDEAPATPPASDAGVAPAPDSAAADAPTSDASTDAPDPLVDARPEPVACTVTPCAVEIAAGADSVCVRLESGGVSC